MLERFPRRCIGKARPKGADSEIGVIHATPVVVNGYVYFGTVNQATFYKLTPDGKVKWSFALNAKDDRIVVAAGFHNGTDANRTGTLESPEKSVSPTAGRVVAISLDTKEEHWRHERPKVVSVGGPPPKSVLKNVGDPVASGLAVANDVVYFTTLMSSKLMALDAVTGKELRAIQLPPVWSGPAVSRGRVYVGTGNNVLPDARFFGPTQSTGTLFSFGLPGEDEVRRMGGGKE